MKVLVIGKTGQLGRELANLAWPASCQILQLGRDDCDLTNAGRVGQAVRAAAPDLVVNAAAYTSVDHAETEPAIAMQVNGTGPAALAGACAEVGAALIHISSDYVFDGTKTDAYVEEDVANPLSVYGRTKFAGECAVRELLPEHVILRTSWLFSRHGNNFVRTMLRLASRQQTIGVVTDQTGAPTWVRDLAETIGVITAGIAAGRGEWGTFHYASSEPTSWFGFARAIFGDRSKCAHVNVVPITTADFGAPAMRPANSVLNCAHIHDAFGIDQPNWRAALACTLAELETTESLP